MVGDLQDSGEEVDGGPAASDDDGSRCLVVMYHCIHESKPPARDDICPANHGVPGLSAIGFCEQIDRLCATLEPIDWPTMLAWSCRRATIPKRSFLLTFDDGLAGHASTVVPILDQRGLRGVFFVSGAPLQSHRMLSAHALHVLLSKLDEERLEREVLEHLGLESVHVPEEDARRMYHYESPARARLKYLLTVVLPIDERAAAIAALFERYVGSSEQWAKQWYLGWDELAQMQSSGHTVGAHGTCHETYARLSPAERRDDLGRVVSLLSDGLGPDLRPISYPYGSVNEDTVAACMEVGFVHGFTTRRDWVRSSENLLTLPRVDTIAVDAFLQEVPTCLQA